MSATNDVDPRTAKSCGPDAPTLASSFAKQFARRWQEGPVTGESAEETVKTIAQGRPDETGGPVVTTLVCFLFFAREAAGAAGTRLSLRPLFFEGMVGIPRAHCVARSRRRVWESDGKRGSAECAGNEGQLSSCPGLSRASTFSLAGIQDVDGRA
jgi:hypothetical protein